MAERRGRTDLGPKTFGEGRLVASRSIENFQGRRPAELGVSRQIDDPHAAAAERTQQFVRSQAGRHLGRFARGIVRTGGAARRRGLVEQAMDIELATERGFVFRKSREELILIRAESELFARGKLGVDQFDGRLVVAGQVWELLQVLLSPRGVAATKPANQVGARLAESSGSMRCGMNRFDHSVDVPSECSLENSPRRRSDRLRRKQMRRPVSIVTRRRGL